VKLRAAPFVGLIAVAVAAAPTASGPAYTDIATGFDFPASESHLESIRARGDLAAQRAHVWQLLVGLTRPVTGTQTPAFLTWYGTGEVFVREARRRVDPCRGTRALQTGASRDLQSGAPRDLQQAFSIPVPSQEAANPSSAPPRITRGHYNFPAYHHIRDSRLYSSRSLAQQTDSIPAFPRAAVVLKTVWWPVPATGVVALPIWDAANNPPTVAGNDYPTWPRVVGVSSETGSHDPVDLEFMGKSFKGSRLVRLSAFFHVSMDQPLAASMMSDPEARKLALIALGRPLRAGDSLALVALHVATRELPDWVWGTYWWHDSPDDGPYATLRPTNLAQPWRNYLMDVAFDRDLPREPDGTPHVAYNPWLEARFADSGQGSGVVGNCMSCHERASTAVDQPFAVTRGSDSSPLTSRPPRPPSSEVQPPGSMSELRPRGVPVGTSFLWSIPMQAH
jgi:hypothetical protein